MHISEDRYLSPKLIDLGLLQSGFTICRQWSRFKTADFQYWTSLADTVAPPGTQNPPPVRVVEF